MRKNLRNTMATTDLKHVTQAWDDFFEAEKIFSKEELNAQGWMTIYDVQEKMPDSPVKSVANRLFNSASHESKSFKVNYRGGARSYTFFRPKIKKA